MGGMLPHIAHQIYADIAPPTSSSNIIVVLLINTIFDLLVLAFGYYLFFYRKVNPTYSNDAQPLIKVIAPSFLLHVILVVGFGLIADNIALLVEPDVAYLWVHGQNKPSVFSAVIFSLIALAIIFAFNLVLSLIILGHISKITGLAGRKDIFSPQVSSLKMASLVAVATNPAWLTFIYMLTAKPY